MGIQGLLPSLKSIITPVHVGSYVGKKAAIDTYSWLHKAAYSCCKELFEGRPTNKLSKRIVEDEKQAVVAVALFCCNPASAFYSAIYSESLSRYSESLFTLFSFAGLWLLSQWLQWTWSMGYTGVDCSTAGCDEQCNLHGGVCDYGVCEFRCSDYAGYTCQNSSRLIPSLSLCGDVLVGEKQGQHCAPREAGILQQLEAAVVMPNYNRLIPSGNSFFDVFDNGYCVATAKRLACWISIQRCDRDGDNRLRVCHSACESYNSACGARLDCSDRTFFSGGDDGHGTCIGDGAVRSHWQFHFRTPAKFWNISAPLVLRM